MFFRLLFFLCRKDHSSISTDDVLSGEVFEATLSHGTTFRNEISMLKDKVERLLAKDDDDKMQMMNTLCKSVVQKIIRVFMEISLKIESLCFALPRRGSHINTWVVPSNHRRSSRS
jgi:hypothetical protein